MNTDLIIDILSIGVIASFVTGCFSLIIAIKNNKKLLQIEKLKQQFSINLKRYELLNNLLDEIEKIQFVYEKERRNPEESLDFLLKVFEDSLDIFKTISDIHKRNFYLFDDPSLITEKIIQIDESITEYIEYSKAGYKDGQVEKVDRICVSIYYLLEDYKDMVRGDIKEILRNNRI